MHGSLAMNAPYARAEPSGYLEPGPALGHEAQVEAQAVSRAVPDVSGTLFSNIHRKHA